MLAVLLLAITLQTQNPCRIELHPDPSAAAEYELATIQDLDIDTSNDAIAHLLDQVQPAPKHRFGLIQYFDASTGRIESGRCGTSPDYASLLELYGVTEDQVVEGRKGTVISVRGEVAGRTLYAKYADGFFIAGWTPALAKLSLRNVHDWAQTVSRSDYAIRYDVRALPVAHRKLLVNEIRKRAQPLMQHRDLEKDEPYLFRRGLADAGLKLVRQSFNDLSTLELKLRNPGPEKGRYLASITCEVVKDSELSKLLAGFAPRRTSLRRSPGDDVAGWLELHMRVPAEFRQVLKSAPTESFVGGILRAAAKGKLEGGLAISASEDAHIVGTAYFDGSLPQSVEVTEEGSRKYRSLGDLTNYRELGNIQLTTWLTGNRVWFGLSPGSVPDNSRFFEWAQQQSKSPPLFAFEVDLAKVAQRNSEGSNSNRMIRALEELFDTMLLAKYVRRRDRDISEVRERTLKSLEGKGFPEKVIEQIVERNIGHMRSLHRLPDSFEGEGKSVIKHSMSEGDWTARGSVTVTATKLTGSLSISRKLHQLYVARTYAWGTRLSDWRAIAR